MICMLHVDLEGFICQYCCGGTPYSNWLSCAQSLRVAIEQDAKMHGVTLICTWCVVTGHGIDVYEVRVCFVWLQGVIETYM